jgi:serine/threonine-protein kinase
MPLAPGTQLDRYVIEALLGSGGMGHVYRALDTRLLRPVALKIIERGDDEAVAEALREARAAAAIRHPHVATIFDAGRLGSGAFVAVELVPGRSLRHFVGDASIDLATRLRWLTDVAGALAAAHEAGVVHRDVKPENVVVRDDGVAKVLDFGVARVPVQMTPPSGVPLGGDVPTPSGQGDLVGTPAYMAPEHIRGGEIDGRADQFSWGVLAYELCAGSLPWKRPGASLTVLMAILLDEPAPITSPDIPEEVSAAVLRALAKPREGRFPSMTEAAAALAPFAAPARTSISSLPPPGVSLSSRPAPAPTSAPPTQPSAPPRSGSSPPREPDFAAPVDLDAHLELLPPGATGKGMFFSRLLAIGAAARPASELCAAAGVPERRYIPFRDYPMRDYLRLEVAVAAAVHPAVPLGEGLRRLGWAALDSLLASHVGKTLFGIFGRDVERLLLSAPKAYELTLSFGKVTAEKMTGGKFLLHAHGLPAFLETYQVGVFEGVLRHCRAPGRVRIALRAGGLADATFEITLP